MVLCGETGNSNMTDMDKLLEEYLMPPPDSTPRSFLLRNSTESLRDGSSSSLDRSGHSSSTNASWNSSCSCHSMSALNRSAKSTFVFHKQSILPPLLCSSSRTEMKVYKRRAIEKEQKIKQKEKQRLISRVEAILSSVEISPVKNKRKSGRLNAASSSDIAISNKKQTDPEPKCSDIIVGDHDDCGSENELNHTYDYSSHSEENDDITIPHIEPEDDDGNSGLNNDKSGCHSDAPSNNDDDAAGFHDNAAYRSSLRNLLQKSMSLNQSLGNSSPLRSKAVASDKNSASKGFSEVSSSSKSTSESEADLTENTVVDAKAKTGNADTVNKYIAVDEELPKNSFLNELSEKREQSSEKIPDNFVSDEQLQKSEEVAPKLDRDCNSHEKFVEVKHFNDGSAISDQVLRDNSTCCSPSDSQKHGDFTEEDTMVNSIVENALEEAKIVLLKDSSDQLLHDNHKYDITIEESFETLQKSAEAENTVICHKNINLDEISSWETPNVKKLQTEISPLSISNSQFFDLHNQSTSTKVNFPLGGTKEHREEKVDENVEEIDQELDQSPILPADTKFLTNEIVELPGEICYDSTIIEPCPVTVATTETVSQQPHVSEAHFVHDVIKSPDDLTMLKPVLSDTVSDVTMTSSAQEQVSMDADNETMKENCDPMESGTLLSVKRSFSYTPDKPSKDYESAVIEAVSQHFQAFKKGADPSEGLKDAELAVAKKKKMHEARVRRGSYTVEEPTPYLLKNKESLLVGQEDGDVCSETTENTGDVKRRLDLPSDSEESSLVPPTSTTKQPENTGNVSKAELNVVNLCRILQDQHKQQMESMKRKHEEQLQSLQQELVKGKKNMSLPLDVAQPVFIPPHDVTVSPSLASTEYRDIRIKDRNHENQKLPAAEYTRHGAEINNDSHLAYNDASHDHTEADLSRISDIKVTPTLHEKLCKLSALCKGHLTRELLGSNKVQDILQIIRDTSRLILSLRLEQNEAKEKEPVRDTYLEDRLYNQLRSALYNLHNIFFKVSTAERMYIIAQSRALNKSSEKKKSRPRTLSTATQKSLERKRLLSTNSDPSQLPTIPQTRKSPKEVKSKISHIWKSDPVKLPAAKKSPSLTLPSKVASQTKKTQKPTVTTQRAAVTSQNKTKGSATSQSKTMKSQSKPIMPQNKKTISQLSKAATKLKSSPDKHVMSPTKTKSPVKTQNKSMASQSSKMASESHLSMQNSKPNVRKTAPGRRPIPLMNRGNIRNNS